MAFVKEFDVCHVGARETLKMSCSYACPHCTMSFSFSAYLRRHIDTMHRNDSADESSKCLERKKNSQRTLSSIAPTCPTCFKTFSTKYMLQKHTMKVHDDLQTYTIDAKKKNLKICSICRKSFRLSLYLKKHMEMMHAEFDTNDDILVIQTSDDHIEPRESNDSIKLENEDRIKEEADSSPKSTTPHACAACPKSFSSRGSLRKHTKEIHGYAQTESVDDFVEVNLSPNSSASHELKECPVCGISLRTAIVLRRHLHKVHSDVEIDDVCPLQEKKPSIENSMSHSCTTCPKSFLSKSALQKHSRKIHGYSIDCLRKKSNQANADSPPSKICSVCGKAFRSTFYLRKHIQSAHVGTDVDEVCPLKTKRRPLESLQALESHQCTTCTKKYFSNSALQNHIKKKCHVDPTDCLVEKNHATCLPRKICLICRKLFHTTNCLRKHIHAAHTDVNIEVVCPLKRPRTIRSLSLSVYACVSCPRTFLRKDVLERHVKDKHENGGDSVLPKSKHKRVLPTSEEDSVPSSILCTLCSKRFRFKCNLRKHIQVVHTDVDVDAFCPVKNLQSKITCPGIPF